MKIDEIVVVEGRDDTRAVTRAVECQTIETHGFAISEETFELIEMAYNTKGIIIFTDPDYAGEQIRKRLEKRFKNAKHAYIKRADGIKKDDIGIENANVDTIIEALSKAKATIREKGSEISQQDLIQYGFIGLLDSKERRQELGKILGIGYANSKGFLKKLNGFGISRETFLEGIAIMENKR